ncbi:hypothetical protein [Amycolatopsis anabasis]|uniref:hypothetical protein n=1 Tax=Amycolatopsis anabasis TaxID=1840409 RepID=UPI00131BCEFE|nr:hypothetical protein [Amycolatopsis anabasis]
MNDECFFHGHEPLPENYYRVCGECGHVFATADELLRREREIANEVGFQPETDPDRVYVCPLCAHDF